MTKLLKTDAVIIGGGIIGLAIAQKLTLTGYEIAVLEASTIGHETSTRNSAVVHAGLYYCQHSLKARFCIEGKQLLKNYCHNHAIAYHAIGKLIIATKNSQINQLHALLLQGQKNGVKDLILIDQPTLQQLEPNVCGIAALYSPSTAIIDSKALLHQLAEQSQQSGGLIYNHTRVTECHSITKGYIIKTNNPLYPLFKTKFIINAAGLGAQDLATRIKGLPLHTIPPLYLAKGNYFNYLPKNPFHHLIYPLPDSAGLGIHATIGIDQQLRFGPDVEWVNKISYQTSLKRKTLFLTEISRYFPAITAADLVADHQHTGIRAKILPKDKQPQDFMIQRQTEHGMKGLINLYGIESPGLTACLSIANYVVKLCQ